MVIIQSTTIISLQSYSSKCLQITTLSAPQSLENNTRQNFAIFGTSLPLSFSPIQFNMQFGYLAVVLSLGSLVVAHPSISQRQAPPFGASPGVSIVTSGNPQCFEASPPLTFSDCLVAFGNSALGTAVEDGTTITVGIDGLALNFNTCEILVQFFNGDMQVSATVDQFSLSNSVQNLFGVTDGESCQVALTLSDSGITGIASDFNPASL